MSKDHIIPRFILKGFAKNPTVNPANQKIMLLDTGTLAVKTEKIADAFAVENFNTQQTEKLLAYKYENVVAKIFQRIKHISEKGEKKVSLSNDEYKLLFRFFVVMWRRNDLHIDRAREFGNKIEDAMKSVLGESSYTSMLNPDYKDASFDDIFQERQDELSKAFYDKVILGTTDDDPTVQKTIKFYLPIIIHNKSKIHFTLHNSYATTMSFIQRGETASSEYPQMIIEPISNEFCVLLTLINGEMDLSKDSYDIPIEMLDNDDEIIKLFIDGYITYNATHFVVDDTNEEIIKKLVSEKARIRAKAERNAPLDPQMEIFKELIRTGMKPPNPYNDMNVGRNEPCPCGSGKKYKKCCLEKYQ